MNKELIISNTLKSMGISADLYGYRYLRYSIGLTIEDPSVLNKMMCGLYVRVAKEFNTTPPRAERAMRHAIETGWTKGDVNLQNKIFGYSIDEKRGKPTNGAFIATIADYLIITQEV